MKYTFILSSALVLSACHQQKSIKLQESLSNQAQTRATLHVPEKLGKFKPSDYYTSNDAKTASLKSISIEPPR